MQLQKNADEQLQQEFIDFIDSIPEDALMAEVGTHFDDTGWMEGLSNMTFKTQEELDKVKAIFAALDIFLAISSFGIFLSFKPKAILSKTDI